MGKSHDFRYLDTNPTLNSLGALLRNYAEENISSPISQYILSIVDQPRDSVALQYFNNATINEPVRSCSLPEGFHELKDYKGVAGIYHFIDADGDSYLGSTADLDARMVQHRTRGLNPNQTHRHPRFYGKVTKNGWEPFDLHIMTTIDLPSVTLPQLYPDLSLDGEVLLNLDKYLITLVEQAYLDTLHPELNSAPFANASFPNLGATGMVRDDGFKEIVSLAHQGRIFHVSTVELHRLNQTGVKLSKETRALMATNNQGVQVELTEHPGLKVTAFKTKSDAAKYLGISMRTLGRWALDPNKVSTTKSGLKVSIRIL